MYLILNKKYYLYVLKLGLANLTINGLGLGLGGIIDCTELDEPLGISFVSVGALDLDNDAHGAVVSFDSLVVNHVKFEQCFNLLHRFALASFAHHSFFPQPQLLGPILNETGLILNRFETFEKTNQDD